MITNLTVSRLLRAALSRKTFVVIKKKASPNTLVQPFLMQRSSCKGRCSMLHLIGFWLEWSNLKDDVGRAYVDRIQSNLSSSSIAPVPNGYLSVLQHQPQSVESASIRLSRKHDAHFISLYFDEHFSVKVPLIYQ